MKKIIYHLETYILFYVSSLYFLLILFAESSPYGKAVVLIAYFLMLSIQSIANNEIRSYPALLTLFIILVPLIIFLIEIVDFAIRVLVPGYIFIVLAITVSKIISRKLEQPILAVLIKLLFLLFYSIVISTITIFLIMTYVHTFPAYWLSKLLLHLKVDTFFIMCLGAVFAWFVLDFLIVVVKNEDNQEKFSTIDMLRVVFKVFFALIFADIFFGFAYVVFVPTEFIGLPKDFSNIMDIFTLENIAIYMRGLYFAFCTHFSLDLPETNFYSGMQEAISSYQFMKIVQFCHISISKVIEITVLAHIASVFLRLITHHRR